MMGEYQKKSKVVKQMVWYFVILLILIIFLFPICWLFLTSFKSRIDILSPNPVWLFKPIFTRYMKVATDERFIDSLVSSIIVSLSVTGLTVTIASLGAYSIARFKFWGQMPIFYGIIMARIIPAIVIVLPFYFLGISWKVIDTHFWLILAHTTYGLPFIVWMLIGFFKEVPQEVEEAAIMDGCSRMQVLWRVTFPLAAPGLVAAAILLFIYSWNEFLFAFVLTRIHAKTLPVLVSEFVGFSSIDWGTLATMGSLDIFPILVFGIIVQRYLVKGLTLGALKG